MGFLELMIHMGVCLLIFRQSEDEGLTLCTHRLFWSEEVRLTLTSYCKVPLTSGLGGSRDSILPRLRGLTLKTPFKADLEASLETPKDHFKASLEARMARLKSRTHLEVPSSTPQGSMIMMKCINDYSMSHHAKPDTRHQARLTKGF